MIKEGVLIGERYEIMGRIGTGGMADVYKGRDHKLNRYVALKVLKREFREDELFVKKFQSEAQAAAGLMHPNIVNVFYGHGTGRRNYIKRIYPEKSKTDTEGSNQHYTSGMCRY